MKKKFSEPLTTAVFTTKFVVEDDHEITYVTHDADDGSWQFLSSDTFEDYRLVAKVVGLGQIIEKDSSILEILNMPIGFYAERENRESKWKIQKQD